MKKACHAKKSREPHVMSSGATLPKSGSAQHGTKHITFPEPRANPQPPTTPFQMPSCSSHARSTVVVVRHGSLALSERFPTGSYRAHYASIGTTSCGIFGKLAEIFSKPRFVFQNTLGMLCRSRLWTGNFQTRGQDPSGARVDQSMWYSPSLQQLLFLEAVLEEGNFVRAADRLNTTHSTISRSLKALSSGRGINLFDKTPRGLKPSSVG